MNRVTSPGELRRDLPGRAMPARPIAVTAEDEREFQVAMDRYKRASGRQFPTWSEILEVLRSIGYAKRIWKPVDAWCPIYPPPIGGPREPDDAAGLVGWFATVETPVGP